jgi:hypothetical protein
VRDEAVGLFGLEVAGAARKGCWSSSAAVARSLTSTATHTATKSRKAAENLSFGRLFSGDQWCRRCMRLQ